MSAYLITRTAVRFLAGMVLCGVVVLGPALIVGAMFGGVL